MATGTIGTVTHSIDPKSGLGRIIAISIPWTADASGNVDQYTPDEYKAIATMFEQVPATGGDAPTDQWDLAIKSPNGVDMTGGGGANRSGTNPESIPPMVGAEVFPYSFAGKIRIVISGAGNGKKGTVIVFVKVGGD